jgi:hypothetical protein
VCTAPAERIWAHPLARAEESRRKIYDMAASEKLMIQGFHYPFPSHGYIE